MSHGFQQNGHSSRGNGMAAPDFPRHQSTSLISCRKNRSFRRGRQNSTKYIWNSSLLPKLSSLATILLLINILRYYFSRQHQTAPSLASSKPHGTEACCPTSHAPILSIGELNISTVYARNPAQPLISALFVVTHWRHENHRGVVSNYSQKRLGRAYPLEANSRKSWRGR